MISKKFFSTIIFLALLTEMVGAQDPISADQDTFIAYTRQLKTSGNKHYLLSNRRGIRLAVDSLTSAIQQRHQLGLLTAPQVDSLMADVYKLEGDYHYENSLYDPSSMEKAENFFTQALRYREEHPIDATHELFILHQELAQLYYLEEHYDQALQSMLAAQRYYDAADSREHLIYPALLALCYARNNQFDEALETIAYAEEESAQQDETYAEILRKKAKILMLRHEAQGGDISEAAACYRKYFTLQKQYANQHFIQMTASEREQYWMSLRPVVTDCYRLEEADPELLFDVTLFAKGLLLQLGKGVGEGPATQAAIASLNYTWQQVQGRLQKEAAAIEFIQYEKAGKQHMGALLLLSSDKPAFVALTDPQIVLSYESGPRTVAERLSTTDGSKKNGMYTDTTGLWPLIWPEALTTRLQGKQHVYFAPDGYQHQIAIEYMYPAGTSTPPHLYRLTSTRQLMAEPVTADNTCTLVCGGVNYDCEASPTDNQDNDAQTYDFMKKLGGGFTYLNGSLTEADSIASYATDCDTLLVGEAVTESTFRQLSGSYPLIFLSTHGYYCSAETPQGTDVKNGPMTDESLSESLVALAGANTNLNNPQFQSDHHDGLLSAREFSSLDMNGVQLFVASACQTGLGQITPDGVYGIQRGLKNAGVGAIVVSLWSVDDRATCALMTTFYRKLRAGNPIHQAFNEARAYLLSTNVDLQSETSFDASTLSQTSTTSFDMSAPRFANAFILIDATR